MNKNTKMNLVVGVMIALFIPITQVQAAWVTFRDPDGIFKANFPRAPKVSDASYELNGEMIPTNLYGIDDGQVGLMIFIGDYTRSLQTLTINDAVRKMVTNGRTLKAYTVIHVDGHEGRYATLVEKGNQFDDEIFVVDRRVYQVITGHLPKPSAAQLAEVARFHQSFHFITQ